jgi:hypothetical protein
MTKISLAFAAGLGLDALAGCANDPRETQIAWSEPFLIPGTDQELVVLSWPEPFLIPGTDRPLQP